MNALEKALRSVAGDASSARRGRGDRSRRSRKHAADGAKSALAAVLDRIAGAGNGSPRKRTPRRRSVQRQADVSTSAEAWDRLYAEWEHSQIVYEGDEREAHDTLAEAAAQIDAVVGNDGEDYTAVELTEIVFSGPDDATKRGAIRAFLERMIQAWIEYRHNEGEDKAELLASHYVLPSLTALSWVATTPSRRTVAPI